MSKLAKSDKQSQKDMLKTLVPYFRLTFGELGGRVTCKLGGYAQPNDRLQDEIIEAVDDDKKFKYGVYDVNYLTQHCNISGSYLVKNEKLPIYCKSVLYSRQFLSGNLFSCFLYFTLDDKTKETVQNKKREIMQDGKKITIDDYSKYYNRLMSGTFTLELMTIDDDFLKNFLEYKRDELESTIMSEFIEEFDNADDDIRCEIMAKINDRIEIELKIYEKYFEPIVIENPRKKKVIQAMNDLFANPHMDELIQFGLKFRDKKRIEESCPDQTFERPKKVISLKELKEYTNENELDEKIDAILNNCSDSDDEN